MRKCATKVGSYYCAKTAVGIKTEEKGFLPTLPKIVLTLRYLLVFIIRVGAIVTYFSPFIGLVGILDHYQVELFRLSNFQGRDMKLERFFSMTLAHLTVTGSSFRLKAKLLPNKKKLGPKYTWVNSVKKKTIILENKVL